jgi:phenylalanyl-tRNA synthetase beta chain
MKFSYSWLASYLPGPAPDPKALGDRLTAVGFIVEGVEASGTATVYDVEITANRPDGMNHRGLAREAAVAMGRAFAEPPVEPQPDGATPADARARVFVEEPALCARYSARVIEGIRVGPSPAAVRERLLAIGSGLISAPVDATNHVLWDIGQPLHAFDLDTLAKGDDGLPAIVVRRAKVGESLVTLDGVTRTLTPQHLVIADAEKPIALAGVMGGLATAISEKTTRILLEAAHFDPRAVRKTARSLGMHTDASHRFERGTDPEATRDGLDRAARLILAGSGGALCRGTIDVRANAPEARLATLRLSRLTTFLGMDIPAARALEILAELGFSPVREGDTVRVTVPSWRVDVACEEDLIEEVIRCEGYDRLPETLPRPYAPARPRPEALVADRARDLLAGLGLYECQTYSFVSASENLPFESAAPGRPVVVENALGEPFTTLRATPVIGLLQSAQHNARRGQKDLALFEVGKSFGWNQEKISAEEKIGDGRVLEKTRVGILLAGARRRHWSESTEEEDLFEGAGIAAALLRGLGFASGSFSFKDDLSSFLASGRAAVVSVGGRDAGWVGVVEPSLAASWDLTDPVVADLDLDLLAAILPPPLTSVEPPPRFPGSEVDITVAHEVSTAWKALEAAVRAGAPPELMTVEAKGRYRGPGVPDGFVKTTLTLRFGSSQRSLARDDVNAWRDAAIRRLQAVPGAKVDGARVDGAKVDGVEEA